MGKSEIEISGCDLDSSNGIVERINNACERLLEHDKAVAAVDLLADFAVAYTKQYIDGGMSRFSKTEYGRGFLNHWKVSLVWRSNSKTSVEE